MIVLRDGFHLRLFRYDLARDAHICSVCGCARECSSSLNIHVPCTYILCLARALRSNAAKKYWAPCNAPESGWILLGARKSRDSDRGANCQQLLPTMHVAVLYV